MSLLATQPPPLVFPGTAVVAVGLQIPTDVQRGGHEVAFVSTPQHKWLSSGVVAVSYTLHQRKTLGEGRRHQVPPNTWWRTMGTAESVWAENELFCFSCLLWGAQECKAERNKSKEDPLTSGKSKILRERCCSQTQFTSLHLSTLGPVPRVRWIHTTHTARLITPTSAPFATTQLHPFKALGN